MLSEKAMLVELVIRQCAFRKLDKQVSQEVNWDKKADSGAARVNKSILKKEVTKDIQKVSNSIRTYHYKMTMPYNDGGQRILPIGNHAAYTKEINKLQQEFRDAVDTLLQNYSKAKEEAKGFLGALYKEEDYPDIDIIADKFAVKISFSPVPDINTLDKLAGISPDDVEFIKKQVKEMEKIRTENAMKDLWERLHTAVSSMAKNLGQKDKIFRNSLIDNLVGLTDLLPVMNVTGDPNLEKMRKEVEAKLCSYDAKELRENKQARKEVSEKATEIADAMSIYF